MDPYIVIDLVYSLLNTRVFGDYSLFYFVKAWIVLAVGWYILYNFLRGLIRS